MSYIDIALREEAPPVVFCSKNSLGTCTPETCQEISDYIPQAWQSSSLHKDLEPGKVINFIAFPADGFPYAIPAQFLVKNDAPVILP